VKFVTEVSRRSDRVEVVRTGRYSSLPKKKTREGGLRKKVSRRSKSSRKGKGQIRAESRLWRLLSAVGATGVPLAG